MRPLCPLAPQLNESPYEKYDDPSGRLNQHSNVDNDIPAVRNLGMEVVMIPLASHLPLQRLAG